MALVPRNQVILPHDPATVAAAIRAVLASDPRYRQTHESPGRDAFETTIAVPWSLLPMPLRVTVTDDHGRTVVRAVVASRWWRLTDVYGVCDRRVRDFLVAVERRLSL